MREISRRLGDKRILVTGAAGGIGREVVRRMCAEGARVAATDLPSEGLKVTGETQRIVSTIPGSLATRDGVEAIVDAAVRDLRGLDALVHCAAIGRATSFMDCTVELWDEIIALNLTATFDLLQVAGRQIAAAGGGSIVAFSSTAGMRGSANNSPYSASKAGVIGLVRAAAVDLASKGIRVNCLVPGPTDTPLMRGIVGQFGDKLGDLTMMRRLGRPEEIAAAAAYLVCDGARYMTGAVFCVDGGISSSGFRPEPVPAQGQ